MKISTILTIANFSLIPVLKTHLAANIPQCMAKVPNKEQPHQRIAIYKHTVWGLLPALKSKCVCDGHVCVMVMCVV